MAALPLLQELTIPIGRPVQSGVGGVGEPKTGSAPHLQSKPGAWLPEISASPGCRTWSEGFPQQRAVPKEQSLLSSYHTASYSSLTSELSEPPDVLFATIPKLPPPLRLRSSKGMKHRGMRKDESATSLGTSLGSKTLYQDESCSSLGIGAAKMKRDDSSGKLRPRTYGGTGARARFGFNHSRYGRRGPARKKARAEVAVENFLKDHEQHVKGRTRDFSDDSDSDNSPTGIADHGEVKAHVAAAAGLRPPESKTPTPGRKSLLPGRRQSAKSVPNAPDDEPPSVQRPVSSSSSRSLLRAASNKQKQMPARSAKLAKRMKRIEEQRGEQLKQMKFRKRNEQKAQLFIEMPENERDALEEAFNRFDIDRSGYLDHTELIYCLREFGLVGTTAEEKKEILKICCEGMDTDMDSDHKTVSAEDVQINLLDLALVVVPNVRMALVELRGEELLRVFCRYDVDGSGKLSKAELKELARGMGLDPRLMEVPNQGGKDEDIDFETFQAMIIKGREQVQRVCRDREREIQKDADLSEQEFQEFRQDLVVLYELFQRFDKPETGTVDKSDAMFMLSEFGLGPKDESEKQDYNAMFAQNCKQKSFRFNFSDFLELVQRMRHYRQDKRREKLTERFIKYDRDRSGYLSGNEISQLLYDLGLSPHSRAEQDELADLIASVDADGSGYIDFNEFQVLSQRIDEKLKNFRYEAEVEFAMCHGFTERQMRDLKWVFDSLDIDGGGTLDAGEVRSGLVMMRKEVSPKTFEGMFNSIDEEGTGDLDFKQFIVFMKLLRESEPVNAEDLQKLDSKAQLLDARILRRTLEYFRLAKPYINSQSHEELVTIFCEYFKVLPMQNLHEALEVKTVGGLYDAAQRRDLLMQSISR